MSLPSPREEDKGKTGLGAAAGMDKHQVPSDSEKSNTGPERSESFEHGTESGVSENTASESRSLGDQGVDDAKGADTSEALRSNGQQTDQKPDKKKTKKPKKTKEDKKNKEKTRKEKPQKKSVSDMSADERRDLKAKKKKRKIITAVALGIIAFIFAIIAILNIDFRALFDDYDSSGDELVDEDSNISGNPGPQDDQDPRDDLSSSDLGFPVDIPEYLQIGYNSIDNEGALSSWEDSYLDTESWESVETDENDSVTWDNWDDEANAPVDSRRELSPGDEGYEEAQGWIFRDFAERQWRNNDVGDMSTFWPSREMGYTNNPDLEILEDGTPNPWYSYVLAEDIQWFFGHNLQRLLNPVYGGWFYWHENPSDIDTGLLRDIFTEQWWSDNIDNGSVRNLPIYADWESNSYGLSESVGDFGWFAEVTGTSFEVREDPENLFSILNGEISLELSALTEEGETITRSGVLEIELRPNHDDVNDINNRILISDVNLRVSE